jgi:hypothetical protein
VLAQETSSVKTKPDSEETPTQDAPVRYRRASLGGRSISLVCERTGELDGVVATSDEQVAGVSTIKVTAAVACVQQELQRAAWQ